MKKVNKCILFACILAIITFFVIIVRLRTDTKHIYQAYISELKNVVQFILDTGKTDGIVIPGIVRIDYWGGEHPIIEFTTSSFGIVPSSTYKEFIIV